MLINQFICQYYTKKNATLFYFNSVIRKLLIGAWRPLLVTMPGVELEALGP